MILTRQQREALKRIWDRQPTRRPDGVARGSTFQGTYLEFRRTVQPGWFGDPAIMLPWCGMWLGIEPDGYTHS